MTDRESPGAPKSASADHASTSTQARRLREREARRDAILDAAERLFADGIADTTMEAVAREAELSKGTLYLYFAGKDALFAGVASRSIGTLELQFGDAPEQAATGMAGLRIILEAAVDFFRKHPHHALLAVDSVRAIHIDQDAPAFRAYRMRVGGLLSRVVGLLERGRTDGSVRKSINPLPFALQLWGSMMGVFLLHLNSDEIARRIPDAVDTAAILPAFVDAALAGAAGAKS